jgi:hypothetical protein
MNYDDGYFVLAAERHSEVPSLTSQQLEVIDLVNSIAARPDVHLTWDLQPGDLQLLNNHTIFHTRDAWEDHEVINQARGQKKGDQVTCKHPGGCCMQLQFTRLDWLTGNP